MTKPSQHGQPAVRVAMIVAVTRGGRTHARAGLKLINPSAGLLRHEAAALLAKMALEAAEGNKCRAARLLGMHRNTLQRWIAPGQGAAPPAGGRT